ncbi:MAG: ATP-binding protein [Sedimentibacter sp.]|jgi:signal transduction histidine kinase
MRNKLIIELLNKLKLFLTNKTYETKILLAYRYSSLLITSLFYLTIHQEHEPLRKAIIIGCLMISSIILSYLYPAYEKSPKNIMTLIAIETIGNLMLLAPSGGIKSPFVWYTINTLLISSVFLDNKYYWLNIITYILGFILLNNAAIKNLSTTQFIIDESNLVLSYIMIVAAIQAWASVIKKIKEESKRLEEANNTILKYIDHTKELYKSVNILANQGNIEGIISISFEHIKGITKTDTVFFYNIVNETMSINNSLLSESMEENIIMNLNEIIESDVPLEICFSGLRFLVAPVSSNYETYGVLGFEIRKENTDYESNIYQLQFLTELISTAFERLKLEEVNHRLLITEEQNRIANDIHDSVLQRLFGMSCGMFSLIRRINDCTLSDIIQELNLFRNVTDTVMKELRNKIYGLSWKKSGYNSFNLEIKKFIDDIKKLNKVNIPFSIIGNTENLSTSMKKALYRIICECIGNSVRHGKAGNIDVVLNISNIRTYLKIRDDGIGFDSKNYTSNEKGLGIKNLYQLTESLQGEILIESNLNKGTVIEIKIPNYLKKGEAV